MCVEMYSIVVCVCVCVSLRAGVFVCVCAHACAISGLRLLEIRAIRVV